MEWKDLPLPTKNKKNSCVGDIEDPCKGRCWICEEVDKKCEFIYTKCKYCPTYCEHINLPTKETCLYCCRDCTKGKEMKILEDTDGMHIEETSGSENFDVWIEEEERKKRNMISEDDEEYLKKHDG